MAGPLAPRLRKPARTPTYPTSLDIGCHEKGSCDCFELSAAALFCSPVETHAAGTTHMNQPGVAHCQLERARQPKDSRGTAGHKRRDIMTPHRVEGSSVADRTLSRRTPDAKHAGVQRGDARLLGMHSCALCFFIHFHTFTLSRIHKFRLTMLSLD